MLKMIPFVITSIQVQKYDPLLKSTTILFLDKSSPIWHIFHVSTILKFLTFKRRNQIVISNSSIMFLIKLLSIISESNSYKEYQKRFNIKYHLIFSNYPNFMTHFF